MRVVAFLVAGCAAGRPAWVRSGRDPSLDPSAWITAVAEDADEEQAKRMASADLAKQIELSIQQRSTDVTIEKNGVESYEVASIIYASSSVRLVDVRLETYREAGRAHVFAAVERSAVARSQAALRDEAKARAAECVEVAAAAASRLRCRALLLRALQHGFVAQVFGAAESPELPVMLEQIEASLDRNPPADLGEAADLIASQLADQGLRGSWTVAPLSFGTTPFSSRFGLDLAVELERALAALSGSMPLVSRGTYAERGDLLRVIVAARHGETGALLGSAAVDVPIGILGGIAHRPQNLAEALVDQRLLADGEAVSGKLRVEVWTNKGDRNLVFAPGEKVVIFLRVNRPAYVQLVYLLANGAKVPLEHAYYLDASKVNRAVEYPASFRVAPPFGAEQLFAIAHTEKPPPLPVVKRAFDGQEYEVVADTGVLVRHRGLVRADDGPEVAEGSVALTTTP